MADSNAAKNQIDLDELERAITGPDFETFTCQNGPFRALIAELRAARLALNEVFHAYAEEFGPDHFAEPTWPAYRFQIAIEDARILSGNVIPVEPSEV